MKVADETASLDDDGSSSVGDEVGSVEREVDEAAELVSFVVLMSLAVLLEAVFGSI